MKAWEIDWIESSANDKGRPYVRCEAVVIAPTRAQAILLFDEWYECSPDRDMGEHIGVKPLDRPVILDENCPPGVQSGERRQWIPDDT